MDAIIALAGVVVLALAGACAALWLSIAQIVDRNRHPSWEFKAAFDRIFMPSVVWTFWMLCLIAAVWIAPPLFLLSLPEGEMRAGQSLATGIVAILSWFFYYVLIVSRIRRPRDAP